MKWSDSAVYLTVYVNVMYVKSIKNDFRRAENTEPDLFDPRAKSYARQRSRGDVWSGN